MSKIKVGILFGGRSKEREISFAGGRTVYDNLNKSIFVAIPLFVDSFGNFILLDWNFVYKGTIRDFYPPVEFIPASNTDFQYYAENLGALTVSQQDELISRIGKKIQAHDLSSLIEFAFLALHGPYGEDGRIQGLLEYLHIPYSGSGILPSAIGIDKSVQKKLMVNAGFNSPEYFTIDRADWINGNVKGVWEKAKKDIGFPMVIKPANQGSSIGISIFNEDNNHNFMAAVEKAFFTKWLDSAEWKKLSEKEQIEYVRSLSDIREGIGMPIKVNLGLVNSIESKDVLIFYNQYELISFLNNNCDQTEGFVLEALDGESTVIIEGFIEGKEFSCIVLEDTDSNNKAVALPPTEIRKGKELFDYRSKYLPGLSRKITPIEATDDQINAIRKECERLFSELCFDVYARIDGFLSKDGKVFLNDPNTTSGMMPSSFFFHQAAEIGLTPSQFLTYIIRASLSKRIKSSKGASVYEPLLQKLDTFLHNEKNAVNNKIPVAVILGGYSSERHISVESGRNIFEKLASSEKYSPIPVFLTGDNANHLMYQIPVNALLKDNADDIKDKVNNWKIHPVINQIIVECKTITDKYGSPDNLIAPKQLSYLDLGKLVKQVFIALHGRPGEDGAVQEQLEKVGLTYNGSGKESSSITIDKFRTNEILMKHGFMAAKHCLITTEDWKVNKEKIKLSLQNDFVYPLIAKPVDDGCSSAVKKIKNFEEFEAFATLIFRPSQEFDTKAAETLHIKPKEEFPQKQVLLVEELISKNGAKHFLEITGGMLTKLNEKGEVEYEVFEASEALAEGDILSLEEKFLAGQGQNITPARYSRDEKERQLISDKVKETLGAAAKVLNIVGYCRIDAFVRIFDVNHVEIIFIEVNSLPGMTPATCIYHQAAINGYKPYSFIDRILDFGAKNNSKLKPA
ncbi:MAG: D-alanine--D-alanine ligase [Bacteroidetes bacterium]|jgi:D-alanine-D-alanine ligase|nr:D-alanine--D-alanine ligase [Bacteroidota bacterium]